VVSPQHEKFLFGKVESSALLGMAERKEELWMSAQDRERLKVLHAVKSATHHADAKPPVS